MSDALQAAGLALVASIKRRQEVVDAIPFADETTRHFWQSADGPARDCIVAFVREAVGCPQCNGTGWQQNVSCTMNPCMHHKRQCFDCPAEHVELSILGETIWADPDKCDHFCHYWQDWMPGVENDGCKEGLREHEDCGWQPRISVLFGEAE